MAMRNEARPTSEARRLQPKAKGERPYFFDDTAVDKVVAIVTGLAGEVAVMRDRVDTIECLLESKGLVTRSDIEHYEAPTKVHDERAAWRAAFLGVVLRIIALEMEAGASGDLDPLVAPEPNE